MINIRNVNGYFALADVGGNLLLCSPDKPSVVPLEQNQFSIILPSLEPIYVKLDDCTINNDTPTDTNDFITMMIALFPL